MIIKTKKKLEENVHGGLAAEGPVLAANFNTGGSRTRNGKRPRRPRSRSLKSLIMLGETKITFFASTRKHKNAEREKGRSIELQRHLLVPGPGPITTTGLRPPCDRGPGGQEMKRKKFF